MDGKLEQLFYVGLGSALLFKEKIEKVDADVRSWQHDCGNRARKFVDQLGEKGAEEEAGCREEMREKIKKVIHDLGLATREDIDSLRRELLDEIRRQN